MRCNIEATSLAQKFLSLIPVNCVFFPIHIYLPDLQTLSDYGTHPDYAFIGLCHLQPDTDFKLSFITTIIIVLHYRHIFVTYYNCL